MTERPQPDRVPDEEQPPHPAEPLKQDPSVIDAMQAFERTLSELQPG